MVLIWSLVLSIIIVADAATFAVPRPSSNLAANLLPPKDVMTPELMDLMAQIPPNILNAVVHFEPLNKPSKESVLSEDLMTATHQVEPKHLGDGSSEESKPPTDLNQRTFQNINPLAFLNSDLFLGNGLALANLLFQRPDSSNNNNGGTGTGSGSLSGSGSSNGFSGSGSTNQQG